MNWWRPRLGPTCAFLVLVLFATAELQEDSHSMWGIVHAVMAGLCLPLIADDWSEWWSNVSWRLWGARRWRMEHPNDPEPADVRSEYVYQLQRSLHNLGADAAEMEIRQRYIE